MNRPAVITQLLQNNPLRFALVGARGGLPGYWQPLEKHLRIIGFEPDERSFASLPQTKQHTHLPIGLADAAGTQTLRLTKKEGVSSVYRPNQHLLSQFAIAPEFSVVGTKNMPVDTLDNIRRTRNLPPVDFMQLDTQGSELPILQGSAETLQTVLGIEVEVEFSHMYENQPLFSDLDPYLRTRGFALFDLRGYYFKRTRGRALGGPKGQLLSADAVYLRTPDRLAAVLRQHTPAEQKEIVSRLLAISLVYGYADYALAIVEQSAALTGNDVSRLRQLITSSAQRRLPDFPARGRLAGTLRRLADWLQPASRTGEFRETLGNANVDT